MDEDFCLLWPQLRHRLQRLFFKYSAWVRNKTVKRQICATLINDTAAFSNYPYCNRVTRAASILIISDIETQRAFVWCI